MMIDLCDFPPRAAASASSSCGRARPPMARPPTRRKLRRETPSQKGVLCVVPVIDNHSGSLTSIPQAPEQAPGKDVPSVPYRPFQAHKSGLVSLFYCSSWWLVLYLLMGFQFRENPWGGSENRQQKEFGSSGLFGAHDGGIQYLLCVASFVHSRDGCKGRFKSKGGRQIVRRG